jgi:tRNA (adenine22-N1)-methyltransferase
LKDIPISNRLKTLAQYIPKGSVLADIGSDHAYLPCYAYMKGIIEKGIAGEVNAGPLASAKETIEKYGLNLHISARLGSGLTVLEKGEATAVTIAGMGGELISHILTEGKDRLTDQTKLILQPNVAEDRVRAWLLNEGWTITNEKIIEEDGHIYEMIIAEKFDNNPTLTEKELMFGPFLLKQKGEPFYKKWESELKKRERILQSLEHASTDNNIEARKQDIIDEVNKIKEVLK